MRVFVAGKSGQLATELARADWPKGTKVFLNGRPELDIADARAVRDAIAAVKPNVIVNAAAYTAVDRAETDRKAAFALNRDGARHLAEEAERLGAPLIQLSTDYVFNGQNERPWKTDDPVGPQSVYGSSKLEGEHAVADTTARHVILRTSWVFAARGTNFVRTMLRLGGERETLSIVDDQTGCPTPARDLARVVVAIAAALECGNGRFGIYHYCGAEAVTWFGFARAIFEEAGTLLPRAPSLSPITTREFGAAAPRPAWSVLDCSALERDFAIRQRPWREGLRDVLDDIRTTGR